MTYGHFYDLVKEEFPNLPLNKAKIDLLMTLNDFNDRTEKENYTGELTEGVAFTLPLSSDTLYPFTFPSDKIMRFKGDLVSYAGTVPVSMLYPVFEDGSLKFYLKNTDTHERESFADTITKITYQGVKLYVYDAATMNATDFTNALPFPDEYHEAIAGKVLSKQYRKTGNLDMYMLLSKEYEVAVLSCKRNKNQGLIANGFQISNIME